MKIEIAWPMKTEHGPSKTAMELAGPISQEVRIPLLPGIWNGKQQALILEISGLSDLANLPGDGRKEWQYCVALVQIQESLSARAITSRIYVDGFSLMQYAAQQERKVRLLDEARNTAIKALLKMRSWFKSRELANIRIDLANALNR